jgi:hypothetical protein
MTGFGGDPSVMAMGAACASCGDRGFAFHPDLVPSVSIDPQTGKPPDVDPEPGGYDRARAEPLCPRCVKAINRIQPGRITVLPGAYPGETQ